MQPTPRHRRAEDDFRRLLSDGDFLPPDDVQYDEASIIFRWHEPKLAVVLDLDG
jgi:hypothetical protein